MEPRKPCIRNVEHIVAVALPASCSHIAMASREQQTKSLFQHDKQQVMWRDKVGHDVPVEQAERKKSIE